MMSTKTIYERAATVRLCHILLWDDAQDASIPITQQGEEHLAEVLRGHLGIRDRQRDVGLGRVVCEELILNALYAVRIRCTGRTGNGAPPSSGGLPVGEDNDVAPAPVVVDLEMTRLVDATWGARLWELTFFAYA